jgi:hypothetical protein
VFILISSAHVLSEESNPQKEKEADVHKDFSLTLEFTKKVYFIDEKIECMVHLKNISSKDITRVPIFAPYQFYKFLIKVNGLEMEPSAFLNDISIIGRENRSGEDNPLRSGVTRSTLFNHLNRLYDMSLKGKYTISVFMYLPKEGNQEGYETITSNAVTITITEPEDYRLYVLNADEKKGGAETNDKSNDLLRLNKIE